MAERLLLYHMLLCSQYKPLPVRSCVLALLKRAKVDPPPLLWTQPGEPPGRKKERIRFSYEVIELWKIHHKVLLDLGHVELYPLLPLTKGGATRKTVAVMFDRLPAEEHREFALIGFTFASIMFRQLKRDKDLEWLERKFRHMHDIIRESPVYEWILEEGEAKGEVKGIAKGIAQMRQTVVEIIQERFPALTQLAEEVVATIDDFAQLRHLAVKLSSAQSVEQAHKSLLDLVQ